MSLFALFDPLGLYLISFVIKTDTKVEHYHTYINLIVIFSHDLYYFLHGVSYFGNWLFTPLIKGCWLSLLQDNYYKKTSKFLYVELAYKICFEDFLNFIYLFLFLFFF